MLTYNTYYNNCTFVNTALRSDQLSIIENKTFDSIHGNADFPWHGALNKLNISFLILNRGAHYFDNATLLREVNATLHFLRVNYPHISIIWRNTATGHYDSKSDIFHKPLTVPPTKEYLNQKPAFHYVEFEGQNELIYNLINEHYPEIFYLDVYTLSALREDAMNDNLHYCSVGPQITWVELIYNVMLAVYDHGKGIIAG